MCENCNTSSGKVNKVLSGSSGKVNKVLSGSSGKVNKVLSGSLIKAGIIGMDGEVYL